LKFEFNRWQTLVRKDEATGSDATGKRISPDNPTDATRQRSSHAETHWHRSQRSVSAVSFADVKKAVQKRGPAIEAELIRAVQEAFPDKRAPRQLVRRARDELFGRPGRRGRPKSQE
jgi:hypothetical protein